MKGRNMRYFMLSFYQGDTFWCYWCRWILLIFRAGWWGEISYRLDILTLFRRHDIITMIFMNAAIAVPESWSSVTLSVATLDILTQNDFSDFQMGGPNKVSSRIEVV